MEWIVIGVLAVAVVWYVRRDPKSKGPGGTGAPRNPEDDQNVNLK